MSRSITAYEAAGAAITSQVVHTHRVGTQPPVSVNEVPK